MKEFERPAVIQNVTVESPATAWEETQRWHRAVTLSEDAKVLVEVMQALDRKRAGKEKT